MVFLFNDTATTETYTLSLHDALPIYAAVDLSDRYISGRCLPDKAIDVIDEAGARVRLKAMTRPPDLDRKSTRLNSSHEWISYAVFCLKKKKTLPTPASQAGCNVPAAE